MVLPFNVKDGKAQGAEAGAVLLWQEETPLEQSCQSKFGVWFMLLYFSEEVSIHTLIDPAGH